MKSLRKWIRDIFGFSGTEINGFLILIPLMIILVGSEPVYRAWIARQQRDHAADFRMMDSVLARWDVVVKSPAQATDAQHISLFSFDPNTASPDELLRLGFSEDLANRIAAYRAKGGVFRVKADLLKIYGLDSALYKQLYAYITLQPRPSRTSARSLADRRTASPPGVSREVNAPFDINTADTVLLKKVYGIGSKLSARIVKFRERLGGFVRAEQLYEVYGLDSIVVERLLKVCFVRAGFTPVKININTADQETLSSHPYIGYKLARLLASYRFQHGDFTQVSDIKKLSTVETQQAERLLPYLDVKD